MEQLSHYKEGANTVNRITYADITASKLAPSGAWTLMAMVGNYLERRTYYGYTKRQALQAFHAEFNA